MLDKVKTALRIKTNAFDGELDDLIDAAVDDLGIAGIINLVENPEAQPVVYAPLAIRAIITYCKVHFGQPSDDEFKRLKASYDEQKAQLQTATGYTNWGE